jgi:hypothetical protein
MPGGIMYVDEYGNKPTKAALSNGNDGGGGGGQGGGGQGGGGGTRTLASVVAPKPPKSADAKKVATQATPTNNRDNHPGYTPPLTRYPIASAQAKIIPRGDGNRIAGNRAAALRSHNDGFTSWISNLAHGGAGMVKGAYESAKVTNTLLNPISIDQHGIHVNTPSRKLKALKTGLGMDKGMVVSTATGVKKVVKHPVGTFEHDPTTFFSTVALFAPAGKLAGLKALERVGGVRALGSETGTLGAGNPHFARLVKGEDVLVPGYPRKAGESWADYRFRLYRQHVQAQEYAPQDDRPRESWEDPKYQKKNDPVNQYQIDKANKIKAKHLAEEEGKAAAAAERIGHTLHQRMQGIIHGHVVEDGHGPLGPHHPSPGGRDNVSSLEDVRRRKALGDTYDMHGHLWPGIQHSIFDHVLRAANKGYASIEDWADYNASDPSAPHGSDWNSHRSTRQATHTDRYGQLMRITARGLGIHGSHLEHVELGGKLSDVGKFKHPGVARILKELNEGRTPSDPNWRKVINEHVGSSHDWLQEQGIKLHNGLPNLTMRELGNPVGVEGKIGRSAGAERQIAERIIHEIAGQHHDWYHDGSQGVLGRLGAIIDVLERATGDELDFPRTPDKGWRTNVSGAHAEEWEQAFKHFEQETNQHGPTIGTQLDPQIWNHVKTIIRDYMSAIALTGEKPHL